MQTSGKPKALREISFIELLVSNDGGVMVFKGVPGQPSLSPVPAELQDEAQSMFKAGMAAARSRPMFRILHDKVPYRFTRLETIDGEEWSIRQLMQDVPEVSRLGLASGIPEALLGMQNLSGLLLVAGAPASAKTTVTSSIFKQWCARNGEYGLTVEQPVEYYMSGMQSFDGKVSKISQIEYEMDAVEPVLRRILRIQARYLMIGEIRSAIEAYYALLAANQHYLVISTLHADDVISALGNFLQLAGNERGEQWARARLGRAFLGVLHLTRIETPDESFQLRSQLLRGGKAETETGRSVCGKIAAGQLQDLQQAIQLQSNKLYIANGGARSSAEGSRRSG